MYFFQSTSYRIACHCMEGQNISSGAFLGMKHGPHCTWHGTVHALMYSMYSF